MKVNISEWHPFRVCDVLTIMNGKGITFDEIDENPGTFVAIQSGEENNGCIGKIDLDYCKSKGYTYTEKPCLTVARTGSAGYVAFQINGCVVGDSAKILLLPDDIATPAIYMFIQTILSANRYKYSYGRKVTESKYMNDYIDLPAIQTEYGYVPDWQFMEDYIKSLHYKPLTTKHTEKKKYSLNVSEWKYFLLKDICSITMGNKLDISAMTTDEPSINFVGRSADNNGVAGKVDLIDDVEPYKAGCVTVALGGSLGSSYLQVEDFYTSQNVSVLEFENDVSDAAKLFITSLIMNESKYKYFPFGRELNTHIRNDFGFTLPVLHNTDGKVFIDETHKYSEEGFVPDWAFMEQYITSLPYGDRL